jgi:DNA modification methylase
MLKPARMLRFGRPGEHSPDRLVHGDNLELVSSLSDGCIDLIYIDPPFGTGRTFRGQDRAAAAATRAELAYSDALNDPERFVTWLEPRLAHSRRLLAGHGSLFVHLDYRSVHYVKVALDRLFGRNRLINEIIWCYSVGGKSPRSFGRKHDTILWYARTADHAFYPEAIRIERKPASHMRTVRTADGELVQEKTDRRTGKVYRYPLARGKIPEDWWVDIELLNRGDRERTGWPTQKPLRLLERLIAATTAPGQLVADWFAGSGTTAVAAQRLDRRFLVADREPAAVDCAARRLGSAGEELAAAGRPPRDVAVHDSPAPAPGEDPAGPRDHRGADHRGTDRGTERGGPVGPDAGSTASGTAPV